jgi:DnaJ-class molecular chaperone
MSQLVERFERETGIRCWLIERWGYPVEYVNWLEKLVEGVQNQPTNMPSTPVCPECWGHGTVFTNHFGGWVKCGTCSGSGKPAHVG